MSCHLRSLAVVGSACAISATLLSSAASAAPGSATSVAPGPARTEAAGDATVLKRPAWTRLRAEHSKKCIEIPGWSKRQGVRADQWSCTKQANMQWALWLVQAPGSGGVRHYIYAIQNRNSGLCLTVDAKRNGAAVTQRQCRNKKYGDNYTKQLFWYTPDSRFFSQYAKGKCLDIAGASKRNKALTTVWKCGYAKNQRFKNIK
ncbi:RICIN domain-containing protein [Actinomadura sp. 6N118]|uniref:RICIN domain-containing protein n=1 Tax=Actinomadura sp. 6N118 TaxID=3375151 RepID=UPI0037B0AAEC